MRIRLAMATATSISALAIANPAQAACEDLLSLDIENGTVTSAEVVAAGAFEAPAGGFGPPPGVANSPYADVPEFCRVQITLTPTSDSDIKSEVWLPLDGWNGKYVGIGNGIWAGQISYSQMAEPLRRGYATASTDTGHVGNGLTAEFAIGHPEKLVDFGHRAVHVTTGAAKAAIAAFYGDEPSISLWNSCSTGGRQGLMSAYRYPEDFDAISAMAPANPMPDLMSQTVWKSFVTKRHPDAALTPMHMGMIHQAVLAQCDGIDGLQDGLISQPNRCNFDPVVLQCEAGQSEGCLNAHQVRAVRDIYAGVRADDGTWLLPGFPRGSEVQLSALVAGPEPFPVALTYFSMLTYGDDPDWNWRATEFGQLVSDSREFGSDILTIPSDGLSPYFNRGGKLLLSHGWNDGLIPATNAIQFHHGLYNSLPANQRDNQLRLFMAPGMDHCSGGEGPSQIDTLAIIDEWATTGMAPNRILAVRPTQAPGGFGGPPPPPREPMERPLCPWPMVATYNGEGDTAVADSFSCVFQQ